MFTYLSHELLSKACQFVDSNCPVDSTSPDHIAIRAEFDALVEKYQEAQTTEQYRQAFQEHMFNDPWSWTIYPDFAQYEESGSVDPIKIILPNGDVIKCRVLF